MSKQTDDLEQQILQMQTDLAASETPEDPAAKNIINGRIQLYMKMKEAELCLAPISDAIAKLDATMNAIKELLTTK